MSPPTPHEPVRAIVLRQFLRVFAASLAVGAVVMAPFLLRHDRGWDIVLTVAIIAELVLIERARIPHQARALVFIVQLALGTAAFSFGRGLDLVPAFFGLALPFLAVLFLGARAAVVCLLWNMAVHAAVGVLASRGLIRFPFDPTAVRMAPEYWPYLVMAEVFAGGPVVYVAHMIVSRLDAALEEKQRSLEELHKAQDSLAASERLKTLGLLAGGVAHDLNNTLTVIAGEVELAEGLTPEERDAILQATTSASQLASQVLLSAGSAVAQPRPIDLQRALRPSLKALARLLPETVRLQTVLPAEQMAVVGDPVLLQHALLNLAVNARDAMPRGGVLTVSLEAATRHGRPHAKLQVIDTGHGMDAATLARATEPFFTTKERGLGTGLGLSNVRSTVEEQGGELELSSEVGAGTRVTVWLPLTDRAALADRHDRDAPAGEGRSVLLVEDNLRVRAIAFEVLQRAGYRVSEAGDLGRAREMLAASTALDALVCDLVLPDGSGLELARAVRQRHPRAGIVIVSGYAPLPEDREALARQEFRYLAKPFGTAALAHAVADAIAAARAERPEPVAGG